MEHRIVTVPAYPWWQRYQPVSYDVANSRSGSGQQFHKMIHSCNDLGVLYVHTGKRVKPHYIKCFKKNFFLFIKKR